MHPCGKNLHELFCEKAWWRRLYIILWMYIFSIYTRIHIHVYTHPCSWTIIKKVHKKLLTVVAFEKEKGMAGEEHGIRAYNFVF